MFVLGLGNKARQGKNWAARAMRVHGAKQGIDVREYAFADALRAYCRVAFGMREKNARLLQLVGTDIFRASNPNIWVDVLVARLQEERPEVAILTDVRFPNERAMVKDFAGAYIRLERLNPDGTQLLATDRDPVHESETALDGCLTDAVIRVADGNLPSLVASAEAVFDTFVSMRQREWQ